MTDLGFLGTLAGPALAEDEAVAVAGMCWGGDSLVRRYPGERIYFRDGFQSPSVFEDEEMILGLYYAASYRQTAISARPARTQQRIGGDGYRPTTPPRRQASSFRQQNESRNEAQNAVVSHDGQTREKRE